MAMSFIKSTKIETLVNGEWVELGDVSYVGLHTIDAKEPEPDVVGLQTEYSMSIEPIYGWADMSKAFGIEEHPTTTITYRPGQQWFQPTLTCGNATIQLLEQREEEGLVSVSFGACAQSYDLQWPNFWARPVYWLWREWSKFRGLIHKFRGIGTERNQDVL